MIDQSSSRSELNQLWRTQQHRNRELAEALDTGFRPRNFRAVILLWSFVLLCVALLAWAHFAELEEVVRAQGKVIPDSSTQIVQSLEGGIIRDLLVREGQKVRAGETLLQMHDAQFSADYEKDLTTHFALRARVVRLQGEADGISDLEFPDDIETTRPDLAEFERKLFLARTGDLKAQEDLLQSQLDKAREKQGLMQDAIRSGALSQTERVRLEDEVATLEGRLATLRSGFVREAMETFDQENAKLATLEETIAAQRDRLERTTICSPVDGVINKIFINTEGRVVSSGEPIMEIVPLGDDLVIEARIEPSDIGFIHEGQRTIVRFSAYDSTRYGSVDGRVETVGADTVTDDHGNAFYPAKIAMEARSLGIHSRLGEDLEMMPGMVADVSIIMGSKTILQYLLHPIRRAQERAMRER